MLFRWGVGCSFVGFVDWGMIVVALAQSTLIPYYKFGREEHRFHDLYIFKCYEMLDYVVQDSFVFYGVFLTVPNLTFLYREFLDEREYEHSLTYLNN